MNKRLNAMIFGMVQGVGLRYAVQRWADELQLTGFVKNESDETVNVVAEGSEEKLKKFLEKLKAGTRSTEIQKVEAKWGNAKKEFKSFNVRF